MGAFFVSLHPAMMVTAVVHSVTFVVYRLGHYSADAKYG